ncbi:hypothetical protein QL285_075303 [Trifolium repens]|nr:hypothetical protein QL285_075303 [Trifolium repens]
MCKQRKYFKHVLITRIHQPDMPNTQQSINNKTKHVVTVLKDGNEVEPLPRQASTIKTRSTPQFYNSRFLKYKQRTINKILPTYHIETKLIL